MATELATNPMSICPSAQPFGGCKRRLALERKQPPSRGTPPLPESPRHSTIPPGRRLRSSAINQLGDNVHGVFRTRSSDRQELAANVVELCFGAFNGNGKIYVNGLKAGERMTADVRQWT